MHCARGENKFKLISKIIISIKYTKLVILAKASLDRDN